MNYCKSILLVLLLLCLSAQFSSAQFKKSTPPDTADYPYWIDMMQNDTVNFFDVEKAYYKYKEKHQATGEKKEEKGAEMEEEEQGEQLFKRWEYRMRRQINP